MKKKGKGKFKPEIPRCPGNPEDYILVKTKYRYYWRRKPESITLNEVFEKSAKSTGPTNEASKRVMQILSPFTKYMELGRTSALIAGAFKKSYLKWERMDFSFLKKLEFQEDHPFKDLCKWDVAHRVDDGNIYLRIAAGGKNMRKPSKIVDSYQFHAILLFGDPAKENGLRIDVESSDNYRFDMQEEFDCRFHFVLPPPDRYWMVLVHIGCRLNVRKTAPSFADHAMQIVEVGGGE